MPSVAGRPQQRMEQGQAQLFGRRDVKRCFHALIFTEQCLSLFPLVPRLRLGMLFCEAPLRRRREHACPAPAERLLLPRPSDWRITWKRSFRRVPAQAEPGTESVPIVRHHQLKLVARKSRLKPTGPILFPESVTASILFRGARQSGTGETDATTRCGYHPGRVAAPDRSKPIVLFNSCRIRICLTHQSLTLPVSVR